MSREAKRWTSTERIPMTITRCPKCHLTINGSMRRRNSNLSDGLDGNGIRDCEDLCQNFPVEGLGGLTKKRVTERQVQSALDNDARRESSYRKCAERFYRPAGLCRHVSHWARINFSSDVGASQIRDYQREGTRWKISQERLETRLIRRAKLIQIIINKYWLTVIVVWLTLRFVFAFHVQRNVSVSMFERYFRRKLRLDEELMQISVVQ